MRELFAGDLKWLVTLLKGQGRRRGRFQDYTRQQIAETVEEIVASLPIYRTYVRPQDGQVAEADAHYIAEAVETAKASRPDLDPDLLDTLRDMLLLHIRGAAETQFILRLQQLTGPVMAKGVEDTALYTFNRLLSLNDVGGDPGQFGISAGEFHGACHRMQQDWPRTMLATSTHDTKRSEDIRARLNLLSEIPQQWRDAVLQWSQSNETFRRNSLPDRNAEYLLYQTLVGALPISEERVLSYMEKATREAKAHTSWISPNVRYEKALRAFIHGAMTNETFLASLQAFVTPLLTAGWTNSLAVTLLKLTAPGIPDIYQGTELWDLSLVDPDNRRPVDYTRRRRLLQELDSATVGNIWGRVSEGLPKLWVTRQALRLRRQRPALFGKDSSHQPMKVRGEKAGHIVAFSRGKRVITIVPRLALSAGPGWSDTVVEAPAGSWRNELTGETHDGGPLSVAVLLKQFPVALLCNLADVA